MQIQTFIQRRRPEGPDHVLQGRSAWHHDLSRVHNKKNHRQQRRRLGMDTICSI
jgi:hypothetical protein